jgi:hypothetical protein
MDAEDIYKKLKAFFPNNVDLMRYLNVNACWEYFVTDKSTESESFNLHFFLYKESKNKLQMTKDDPNIKPDLILYFTERAILDLIKGDPSAEEYYSRYHEVMTNPKPGIEVDNKVNKPRLKLWQMGYKKWQSDFKF